jgi:hypothetical protein
MSHARILDIGTPNYGSYAEVEAWVRIVFGRKAFEMIEKEAMRLIALVFEPRDQFMESGAIKRALYKNSTAEIACELIRLYRLANELEDAGEASAPTRNEFVVFVAEHGGNQDAIVEALYRASQQNFALRNQLRHIAYAASEATK